MGENGGEERMGIYVTEREESLREIWNEIWDEGSCIGLETLDLACIEGGNHGVWSEL